VNSLFPIDLTHPQGFNYIENFISLDEEKRLIDVIKETERKNMTFHGYEAKRKTKSYGYDYTFENGSLKKGEEIPESFNFLLERTAEKLAIDPKRFSELLLTEYPVGSVINWHRDAPPFDIIAGISLNSDCVFRLRPQDKTRQKRSSIISIPVKRRSLYILSGEARSEWQHSISPVKEVRYSITLRTLREKHK
jgi:alkylated DNA repair dioxygenase AlkB